MKKTIIAAMLLFPLLAIGQTTINKTLSWTAPVVDSTHSAAVSYIVRWHAVGATAWNTVSPNPTTTSCQIPIDTGVAVVAQVMAVDASGNTGPWSTLSDPFIFKVPGGCGIPVWN
jgi:hypothetical protein